MRSRYSSWEETDMKAIEVQGLTQSFDEKAVLKGFR